MTPGTPPFCILIICWVSSLNPTYGTTIHPAVGAELKEISAFPADVGAEPLFHGSTTCTKMHVDGSLPDVTFVEHPTFETRGTAYIVEGSSDGLPFVIINDSDAGNFEKWTLDDRWRFLEKVTLPTLHTQQNEWVDYSALDIACLLDGRLLVAINYYESGPHYALYLYNIAASKFSHIAEIEPNLPNTKL